MTKKCLYCDEVLVEPEFETGLAVKTGRDRYAHTDCIDGHGKNDSMENQTQHILGAADSAHQGIGLAVSLLQECMGNMGEILREGCVILGPASLGSTMRVGQSLKEGRFLLAALQQDAHALCTLLGLDLGVGDGAPFTLGDLVGEPIGTPDVRDLMDDTIIADLESGKLSPQEYLDEFHPLDSEDLEPGEDEFDDDEIPF